MRVVHIITSLGLGGAETVLYRLVKEDLKNNTALVVSLSDRGVYADKIEALGVRVEALGYSGFQSLPRIFLRLVFLLRQYKPHAVQTWMYHADLIGGIAARISGVSNVIWGIRNGSLDVATLGRATVRIAYICALIASKVPRRIVSCSNAAVDTHAAFGYEKERFVVIQNGLPGLKQKTHVEHKNQRAPDFRLINVARFHPVKNHLCLIKALRKLKNRGVSFKCLFVGEGMQQDNETLVQAIEAHQLTDNVILMGRRDDVEDLLSKSHVHVLSSDYEGFPNVVVESMAQGLPNVSTDAGDAREIISDTGWVVDVGDSTSIAESLYQANLERTVYPESWQARREHCFERVSSYYSIEYMVEKFNNVWSRVD